MDKVFRALADPSRRRLLDSLNQRTGWTLRELCTGQEMTRQSVSKHLAVLEAANLITTVRRGRGKLHYLSAAPSAPGQDPGIGAAGIYRGFIDAVNRQDLEEAARFVDAARYRENCVGFTRGFVDWEEAKAQSPLADPLSPPNATRPYIPMPACPHLGPL